MAVLRMQVEADLSPIADLARLFPSFHGRYLALIGKRGRHMLKREFLSGQELTLKGGLDPKDARGRQMIVSDVNKKRTQVKIYSYPVNLFERGRRLRSGRKEAGRYIITRKLKAGVEQKIPSYAREFESRILQDEIDKLGL